MRVSYDYGQDEWPEYEHNDRALIILALDKIDGQEREIEMGKTARKLLTEDLARMANSTCACCHAKFGAKPIFSDPDDMSLPGDEEKVDGSLEGN